MNVSLSPLGQIAIRPPNSKAGDFVLFKALADLLVGLTACSHEETNNGVLKPIQYQILNDCEK